MEVRWQYRRLKYDENEKTDMGGKKLFFVFCACGDGGRRGARREVSNLQRSYVKKENFVLAEFLSLLKGQKNLPHFTMNLLSMLTVSHVNASPTAPSQLK